MNFAAYLAAFPQIQRDYGTGGGCTAWYIQLPNDWHILVTCEDDPSQPLPTDEQVAIGLYHEGHDSDWGEAVQCDVVPWADAIEYTHACIAKAAA